MRKNILDSFNQPHLDDAIHFKKILLIVIGSITVLIGFEQLNTFLPQNLVDYNNIQIKTRGIIILSVILFMSIIIPEILNQSIQMKHEYQIAASTGLIIFTTEFLFKIIQNVVLFNTGWDLDYFSITKLALTIGFIGGLIANVKIHKLRKKKIIIPFLLLIGLWLLVGFIYSKV